MRWIKASERLPEEEKEYCMRNNLGGRYYHFTAINLGEDIYQRTYPKERFKIAPNEIEWLDETESQSSALQNQDMENKFGGFDGFARGTFYKDEGQCYVESLPESVFRNPKLSDIKDAYNAAAKDYKEVIEDNKRLVRELDVIINGEKAAKQASLCDLVSQIRNYGK